VDKVDFNKITPYFARLAPLVVFILYSLPGLARPLELRLAPDASGVRGR